MRNKLSSMKLKVFLFCIVVSIRTYAGENVNIIVHPTNNINSITVSDLKKIYTGKTTVWEESKNKSIVVAIIENEIEFFKIIKLVPRSFNRKWIKISLSGKGNPPKKYSSKSEMITFVKNTPGAIGWFVGDDKPEGVKIISIQ